MSVQVRKFATALEAAEACAHAIVARLERAIAGAQTATLAISGGTSPVPMFQTLARADFDWTRVHLFWVDERAVPPTDEQSNYRMAEQHLIRPARFPMKNIHRVKTELGPEEAARRYADEIREFFSLEGSDLPHFDVIHRGMGADAHTASLFPGDPLIENSQDLVAAVWVKKLEQARITLLPGVLRAARRTVVLATGEDKAEALRGVLESRFDPKRYPAQLGAKDGRPVDWFVDEPAARLIG